MTASSSSSLVQRTFEAWPFQQACWTSYAVVSIEKLNDRLDEKSWVRKEVHLLAMRLLFLAVPLVAAGEAVFYAATLGSAALIRYAREDQEGTKKHLRQIAYLVVIAASMALCLPLNLLNPLQLARPEDACSVSKLHEQLEIQENSESTVSRPLPSGIIAWRLDREVWTRRSIEAIATLNARLPTLSLIGQERDLLAMRVMMLILPVMAAIEAIGLVVRSIPQTITRIRKKESLNLEKEYQSVYQLGVTAIQATFSLPLAFLNPSLVFPARSSEAASVEEAAGTKALSTREPQENEEILAAVRADEDSSPVRETQRESDVEAPTTPVQTYSYPDEGLSPPRELSELEQEMGSLPSEQEVGYLSEAHGAVLADAAGTESSVVLWKGASQEVGNQDLLRRLRTFIEGKGLRGVPLSARGSIQVNDIAAKGLVVRIPKEALAALLEIGGENVVARALTLRSGVSGAFLEFFISGGWFTVLRRAMDQDPALRTWVEKNCQFFQPLDQARSRVSAPSITSDQDLVSLIATLRSQKQASAPLAFLPQALEAVISVLKHRGKVSQKALLEFFKSFEELFIEGKAPIALRINYPLEKSFMEYDAKLQLSLEAWTDDLLIQYLPDLARSAPTFEGVCMTLGAESKGTKLTVNGLLKALEALFTVRRSRWRTIELIGIENLDVERLERILHVSSYIKALDLTGCGETSLDILERLKTKYRVRGVSDEARLDGLDQAFRKELEAIAASFNPDTMFLELIELFQDTRTVQSDRQKPTQRAAMLAASALRSFGFLKNVQINDDFLKGLVKGFKQHFPSLRGLELNARSLTLKGIQSLQKLRLTSLTIHGLRLGKTVDASLEALFKKLNHLVWNLSSIGSSGRELSLEGAQQIAAWIEEGARSRGVKATYRISYVDESSAKKKLALLESPGTAASALPAS